MALICIHGARLVSASGVRPGGVVVGDDGRIEAVLEGADRAAAETVVHADGRLVFPGFVDAHVHMRDPGFPEKETFASGSAAAAAGGVTTVMCMPNTRPAVDSLAGFEAMRRAGEGASRVDFCIQAAAVPGNVAALPALWQAGVVSFEALMSDAPEAVRLDAGSLTEVAAKVAGLGGVLGVYTGVQAMVEAALGRLAGRGDFAAFAEARPPEGEAAGLGALVEAVRATGCRTVARQVSTARGFEIVRAAKRDLPLAVEATPHHLRLDEGAVARFGPFALMVPPLRSAADRAAAEAALADGTVDFVGSDHAPHARAEKDVPGPWLVPGGTPGLDTIAPAVVDLAARGVIDWPRVAEALCERPARLFGIADRKGRLAPGADGDLVLVDPAIGRVVEPAAIRSKAGRSPFEGMLLRGWPMMTVLRGRVIFAGGAVLDRPPAGRFVARGTPDWS